MIRAIFYFWIHRKFQNPAHQNLSLNNFKNLMDKFDYHDNSLTLIKTKKKKKRKKRTLNDIKLHLTAKLFCVFSHSFQNSNYKGKPLLEFALCPVKCKELKDFSTYHIQSCVIGQSKPHEPTQNQQEALHAWQDFSRMTNTFIREMSESLGTILQSSP